MNKIKLYLLGIVVILTSGCTNPNTLSIGTIQDKKNVQYRENDYLEVLVRKDIAVNGIDIKQKLIMDTQICVKRMLFISNTVYSDEIVSTNGWFEITDDKIILESNVRNVLKNKNDVTTELIKLGGKQGNRMYKIALPYKITKSNDDKNKLTVYNSENIDVVESINNSTNKVYEPTMYNFDIDKFKHKVISISTCISNQ